MSSETRSLKRSEAATLRLRSLYEKYGYRKYRMGSFEEYSLYAANKSFLPSENVLTFTDLDGRLMALRPDITLGIAKNIKIEEDVCEKVYYIENVYRESKESHTYREISQMGLECMGNVDDFVIVEVVSLAIRTLADFGVDYVLKISNMDFVLGLMDEMGLEPRMRGKMLSRIRRKNRSELELLCEKADLSEEQREKILKVPFLYGEYEAVLEEAEAIADTPAMRASVKQLRDIYEILQSKGLSEKIRLDLSMINDIEYYNGIIFQGYLDGLAGNVLSGGQYDGVMKKMKKKASAIGFALYLKELDRLPEPKEPFDAEVLLLYREGVDFKKLCKTTERLRREGLRVRVDRSIPRDMHFCYIYRFGDALELICDNSAEGAQEKETVSEPAPGKPAGKSPEKKGGSSC